MDFEEVFPCSESPTKQAAVRHHTRESERKLLVKLWLRSGLSSTQFCKKHKLNPKTFSNWKSKVLETTVTPASETESIAASSKAQLKLGDLSVALPNGIKLSLTLQEADFLLLVKELAAWNLS